MTTTNTVLSNMGCLTYQFEPHQQFVTG